MKFVQIAYKITKRLFADSQHFLAGEPVLVDTKIGIIKIERMDAVKKMESV